jgi:guanylate kinase
MNTSRDRFLVVVSAPSGTGKTTVIRRTLERVPDLSYSVSATTRDMRPGERDGESYHFVQVSEFERWIREDRLFEWAKVYEDYYGTPKSRVLEAMKSGNDVILDLDVQGKRSLESALPGRTISVFLHPPGRSELRERLLRRGSESGERLRIRMKQVDEEIRWAREFDYWVLNDDVDEAAERLEHIIRAERMRRERFENDLPL